MVSRLKLTPAQIKKLASLTEGWREEPDQWKARKTFLDLEAMGFCEMESRRIKGGSITTGPGNTSVYRWFTRRTDRGTAAFVTAYSRQTIERTEHDTR